MAPKAQSSLCKVGVVDPVKIVSPASRSKLLSEYKQKLQTKSPAKSNSLKRKTQRLKCQNEFCRVGFTTKRAREHHEIFVCSFRSSSNANEVQICDPLVSDENTCRYCGKKFSNKRNRKRHEVDVHYHSDSSSVDSMSGNSRSTVQRQSISSLSSEGDANENLHSSSYYDFNENVYTVDNSHIDTVQVGNITPIKKCRFCYAVNIDASKFKRHEEACIFKLPKVLSLSSIKIPQVRLLANCEILNNLLGYASVEDLYKYNEIARICVPGVYPLIFPGKNHFGRTVPPIVNKTAYKKSFNILMKLLKLDGEVVLNNHLVLVDDKTGQESYLGPRLLIPESNRQIEVKSEDNSKTCFVLRKYQAEEKSFSSDESDSDVDDPDEEVLTVNDEQNPIVCEQDDELLPCEIAEEDVNYLSKWLADQEDGINGRGFYSLCNIWIINSIIFRCCWWKRSTRH